MARLRPSPLFPWHAAHCSTYTRFPFSASGLIVACDLKSMSVELPWSVDELVALNRVKAATHMVEFWAQELRLKQLNDYCDKTVAEIRASLDRTQDNQAG